MGWLTSQVGSRPPIRGAIALALAMLLLPAADAVAQVRLETMGRNTVLKRLEATAREAFKRLDSDANAAIEVQELVQLRRREFNRMDRQKTREVSIGQYQEHFGKKGKDQLNDILFHVDLRQEFHKLDRDQNKRVSRAEYISPVYIFIARFDIDGDGKVSEQELIDNLTFKNPPTRPPLPPAVEERLAREGRLPKPAQAQ